MKNVKIYSTPTCGYCKMAKEFFKENNIEFTDIDVSADDKIAEEMIHKSGQMGTPVIILEKDGKEDVLVGFDREKLSEALDIK